METKNTSFGILKIGAAVFVGMILLALYLKFQNSTLAIEANALRAIEDTSDAIANEDDKMPAEKIQWPEIIEQIRHAIPKLNNLEPLVTIISYAGEDEELRIEAATREQAFDPMNDVTVAFDALRNEKILSDAHLGSLAKSQNGTSTRIYFSITIPLSNP